VFAFYSSWRVALVILLVFPVVAAGTMATQYYNVTASQRAAKHYERAGGISYAAVSAIKTVLSLNAVPEMIRQYNQATKDAFHQATFFLAKKGLANGKRVSNKPRPMICWLFFALKLFCSTSTLFVLLCSVAFIASFMASFLTLYAILTLYGSSLLYKEVELVGCDPSASVVDNATCGDSAPEVFAAMMGVAFAAQGVASFGNCLGMIDDARVAAYRALQAIHRKPGADCEIVYKEAVNNENDLEEEEKEHDDRATDHSSPRRFTASTNLGRKSKIMSVDVEQVLGAGENGRKIKGILPRYEIDSTSRNGVKPAHVHGAISIKDVHFSYPTRPDVQVFNGISIDIPAGTTVAFVGASGGGCVFNAYFFYCWLR
jgi:ATP-binding cassette, subfamily B (MDR/TAP), member 1